MGFSEKSILEPEPPKPGIPLKKSTLAVLVLIVLVVGLITSLLVSSGTAASSGPTAVASDPSEIKNVGTEAPLREEEEEVRKRRAAAARPPLPGASASAAMPPLPAASGVPHLQGKRDGDLEQEAAVRMSKVLAHDFDEAQLDPRGNGGAGDAASTALLRLAAAGGPGSVPVPGPAPSANADVSMQMERVKQLLGQTPAGRNENVWLKELAKESDGKRTISGYPAARGYVLRQGKVIPAVLGRQINSDLPGRLTAYVSTDVFDSDGHLVVPKGSMLVGAYDSQVSVGQTRMMFAFNRLILPNGYSFDLPAAPGTDLAGATGMTGDVNNHFFKMFGTSLLIAVLADRTKQPSTVTQVGATGPATAAGQVLADVSKTILERNRLIPPTITVDQGTRINVEVVGDMVFPEPYPR